MRYKKSLKQLQDLMNYGNFREVIQLAQDMLQGDLAQNEMDEILLYKCRAYSLLGDLSSYNETISQVQIDLDAADEIKIRYFECEAFHWFYQGDYTKFMKIIQQIEEFYLGVRKKSERLKKYYIGALINYSIHVIMFLRDYDTGLSILTKLKKETEKIKDEGCRTRLFRGYAWLYMLDEKLEKSLEYAQLALKIAEKNGFKIDIINVLYVLAFHAILTGDRTKLLFYLEKALKLATEIEFHYMIFILYMHLASYHQQQGNYNKSLEYNGKTHALQQKFPSDWIYMFITSNMGEIYYIQGDFEKALELLKKSLDLSRKLSYDIGVLLMQIAIGKVYLEIGDVDKSEWYFLQALETAKSNSRVVVANSYELVFYFSDLIDFFINQKKTEKAKEIYQLLNQLSKNSNSEDVNHYLNYARASLLKSSRKFKDIVEAQDILRNLMRSEANHDLTFKIRIRMKLCDLLLTELEFSEDEEIWKEIEEDISHIEKLNGGKISLFLVSILRIKAQFALISQDITRSLQILDEALKISETIGLNAKIKQISEQKENILEGAPINVSRKQIKEYIQDAMRCVNEWKSSK